MSVTINHLWEVAFGLSIGTDLDDILHISREYGSCSYMKVIGSSLRSQEQNRSKIPIRTM